MNRILVATDGSEGAGRAIDSRSWQDRSPLPGPLAPRRAHKPDSRGYGVTKTMLVHPGTMAVRMNCPLRDRC